MPLRKINKKIKVAKEKSLYPFFYVVKYHYRVDVRHFSVGKKGYISEKLYNKIKSFYDCRVCGHSLFNFSKLDDNWIDCIVSFDDMHFGIPKEWSGQELDDESVKKAFLCKCKCNQKHEKCTCMS